MHESTCGIWGGSVAWNAHADQAVELQGSGGGPRHAVTDEALAQDQPTNQLQTNQQTNPRCTRTARPAASRCCGRPSPSASARAAPAARATCPWWRSGSRSTARPTTPSRWAFTLCLLLCVETVSVPGLVCLILGNVGDGVLSKAKQRPRKVHTPRAHLPIPAPRTHSRAPAHTSTLARRCA